MTDNPWAVPSSAPSAVILLPDRSREAPMPDEIHDLRNLANELERVGRASPAWSMVHKIVYNATDQINSMAAIMELRRKLTDSIAALRRLRANDVGANAP